MNSLPIPKQVLAGFAIAVFALVMGVYFGAELGGDKAGSYLLRLFSLFAIVAIVKSVFAWGESGGIRSEEKTAA